MLSPGTIVAGYRIEGILGLGGMGVVYEATQLSLDRKVALKLIAPQMGASDALQERFRREALRQAAIDHPHIVTVHEAGETEHGLHFAMRLVRGPTLKDMVRERELDVGRTLRILSQIADALDAAHDAGLIHRDVKPQNILVGPTDHAYLADFGLTKALGDRGLTQSGRFVGTLDYVAPEQIRGEGTSARTDVYALAAVLYECLTGVVPYQKDSEAALIWAHLALAPPRVSKKRPDLPAPLDAVIERGLAKQPQARFATAGEMLRRAQDSFSRARREAMSGAQPIEQPGEAANRAAVASVSTVDADVPLLEDAPSLPERSPTLPDAPPMTRPPRTSDPTARRLRRPRGAIPIAIAVVLAGGISAGGYLSGASRGPAREGQPLAAGRLRLEVPADWQRVAGILEVPGLALSRSAGASPEGSSGQDPQLLAGVADGTGQTLLPAAFLKRLPRRPGTDDVVELGKLEAYRYRALRPRGLDRPLTLFVVPTEKGVATVACLGTRAAGPRADCERAAATLELEGVRGLALGARDDYARGLNAAIGALNTRRKSGRTALRRATTASSRHRAARALARAFERAASSLATVPAGPAERPAHEALRDEARGARAAYSRLASAAARESVGAFSAAASSVRRHEFGIERDLHALGRLGYSVK